MYLRPEEFAKLAAVSMGLIYWVACCVAVVVAESCDHPVISFLALG